MRDIPLARAAALQPFLNWLNATNVPIERSLHKAKLDEYAWDRPESPTPLINMLNFVDDIAAREGLDDLGFRVFSNKTLTDFGMVGQFIAGSATPREAVQRASRSLTYFCPNEQIRWGLDPLNPSVHVKFDQRLNARGVHFALQLTAMLFSRLVDAAGDGRPQLERAEISKLDGAQLNTFRPWLGDNVRWSETGCLSLYFRSGALDRPFASRIAPTGVVPELPANWLKLKDAPSLIETLRIQIEEMLIEGAPTVRQVADTIGMSTRTLQRRLTTADTSFSELLDDVRYVNAMAKISGSSLPLKEIATELGYADQACFSRTVRRWEARTPRDIRQSSEAVRQST